MIVGLTKKLVGDGSSITIEFWSSKQRVKFSHMECGSCSGSRISPQAASVKDKYSGRGTIDDGMNALNCVAYLVFIEI